MAALSPDGSGNASCPSCRVELLLGCGERELCGSWLWIKLTLHCQLCSQYSFPFCPPLPHFFDNSSPVRIYLMGGLSIYIDLKVWFGKKVI